MSESWRPVNLNDEVRFKLTPRGERIWLDYWRPYVGLGVEPKLPRRDGEWFVEQLWQIANILGPHMGNGIPVPMETTFEVKVPSPERDDA